MNEENKYEPKKDWGVLIELLVFLGILCASLFAFVLLAGTTLLIATVVDSLIIVIDSIVCVKAFKSKKTLLGILLLCFIIPIILILMLFGACAFLFQSGM